MKKNALAIACTALLAMAIVLPATLQGLIQPGDLIQQQTAQPAAAPQGVAETADAGAVQSEAPGAEAPEAPEGTASDEPEYDQGVVLVSLSPDVSIDQLNARLAELDYIAADAVSAEDAALGFVELPLAEGVDVQTALGLISGESFAEAAQPNYVYHLLDEADGAPIGSAGLQAAPGITLDDLLAAQTTKINDPRASEQWALEAVHAYDAWDLVKADQKVTVAVLDSGCTVNHEDLKGNIVAPYSVLNATSDVTDPLGHGTHVAGIISAMANNGVGVAGVSYNARVMPVQVIEYPYTDETGKVTNRVTTSDAYKGVNYIISNAENYNIRVINISFGTDTDFDYDADSARSDTIFKSALERAEQEGILVVCCAGNGGRDGAYNCFPCDFADGAVGVISVRQNGNTYSRTTSSNYNLAGQNTKDISAPGNLILSTKGTGYANDSGTSMAAPYVSGIAALMFAADANLTPAKAKETIDATAQDLGAAGFDLETGYGLVDAKAALEAVLGIDPSDDPDPTPTKTSIANATVTLSPTSYTYDGQAKAPTPTVVLDGKTLVKGTDYTVAYANNVNAGTATATVTGQGDYTGTKTATFSIAKASVASATVTLSQTSYAYDGTAKTPGVSVKLGNKTLTPRTEYTVTYVGNTNVGNAAVVVAGTGNYTGSINKTFTITGTPMALATVTLSPTSYTYDGQAKAPTPTVVLGGKTLVKNTDYTVAYANNVNAGTATATVTGKGNYAGTKTATFTIAKASLASATVTLTPSSYSFDGTAKTPLPTVKVGSKTLTQGTDYTVAYANNVNAGTATATVTGKGNYTGTKAATFTIKSDTAIGHSVRYRTHVESIGTESTWRKDGATSGTSGRALRLEAIYLELVDHPYSGSITYRTHVQDVGWQGWKSDGAMSGTSGQAKRLEAIEIKLTGEMANHYDVYYRVHAENIGWMSWAKNGASAGTAGYAYRLEAIQIVLVAKGGAAPAMSPAAKTSEAFRTDLIQYRTHVENVGWQGFVADGAMSGTSGRALRLEGINIRFGLQSGISGSVQYRTHIENIGWESGWKSNGAMSGTSGRALRLEAIQIKLAGAAADRYDIYYRVHCQSFGWMGWAKNGESAGSEGYAYRLEGIQVKLVPKGGSAPGSTANAFRKK